MESKYEKEIEKSEKAVPPSDAGAAASLSAGAGIAAASSYEKFEKKEVEASSYEKNHAEAPSFRKKRATHWRGDAGIADASSLAAKDAEFGKKEEPVYLGDRATIGEASSFAGLGGGGHAPATSHYAPHGVAAELYGAGDGHEAAPGPWASHAFQQRLQSPPPLTAPGRFATSAPVGPVVADGSDARSYASNGSSPQNSARRLPFFTFLEAQIDCRMKDFDSRITKNFIIA